jgi:aminopeptidase N
MYILQVEPGWKVMDLFVIDEVHNVLALDALETSHPISIVVGHPDEINEIFDRISYGKGNKIFKAYYIITTILLL